MALSTCMNILKYHESLNYHLHYIVPYAFLMETSIIKYQRQEAIKKTHWKNTQKLYFICTPNENRNKTE